LIAAGLFGLAVLFAGYTVLYDLALVVPLSLRTVSWVWLAGVVFVAFFLKWRRVRRPDGVGWLLLALSAAAASVACLSNRPDADDSFYLARAIVDWESWAAPIVPVYAFAFTSGAGGVFTSLPSYEHATASLAALLGVHPLVIYHLAAPALLGALVPPAWYVCLRAVGLGCRGASFGTAALLILMLLDGTTHRGIANVGLVRMFQGKIVLLTTLTPLAIAASVQAIRQGGATRWIRLGVLGVAGIGLSTTAAFFLPILVGVAGATHWLAVAPRAPMWRVVLAPLVVFAYPALCVLPLYRVLAGPDMIFATDIAHDLPGVLGMVYGTAWSPTVMAAVLGVAGLLGARRWRWLLWVLVWTACLALPLAWPPIASLVVRYVTTADALWRLAYASPVILVCGLGIGAVAEVVPFAVPVLGAVAAGTVGLGLLKWPPSPFADPTLRFPSLAFKLPAEPLAVARLLAARLPPGRMLAPRELSTVLPTVTGKFRLTNFREFDAAPQLVLDGRPDLAAALTRAHDFISGLTVSPQAAQGLGVIAVLPLEYVVLSPVMPDQRAALLFLPAVGYVERNDGVAGYRVFQRVTPAR